MAYVIRIRRYVAGREAALDEAAYDAFIAPYTEQHLPAQGYRRIRADDGAVAGFCTCREGGDADDVTVIAAMRFGGAASVLDLMIRLAERIDAVIVAADCPAMLVAERQRAQIPPDLRDGAVVVASGDQARQVIGYV